MTRPQVVVNVSARLPRRGTSTATGRPFFAFTGGSGSTDPLIVEDPDQVVAAYGGSGAPDAAVASLAAWVGDALTEGASDVVVVRTTAAAAAPTEAEWTTSLSKLTDEFGPGQVLIPGVSTAGAHNALLGHANAFPSRTVLLDAPGTATAAAATTLAGGYKAAPAALRATLCLPSQQVPAPAATTREVPLSVLAAGIIARGDTAVGHANNAPIFDQGRGAGQSRQAVSASRVYTSDELDALYDAGVLVMRPWRGVPTLTGFPSLSPDRRFRQLNTGRIMAQLGNGVGAGMEQFLGRNIDGRGQLYAEVEGALRAYLLGLYSGGALYGETPDDAFDVLVAPVNSPSDAGAGILRAAVEACLAQHTEKVRIDVVTYLAEGARAA